MNFFGSKDHISHVDRLLFTKHLAVMLKSGITLAEAIQLLTAQATNPNLKQLLTAIQKDVDNGKPFYDALAAHPVAFDSLYLRLVSIGEESGTLQRNLEYLSIQLRKKYDFDKKVSGALLYPGVIITAAIIAGGGISIFVLPQLIDLFESLDMTLPLATQVLLFIAKLMKDYGIAIIIGFVLLLLLLRQITLLPSVKPYWQTLLLRSPILGTFFQNVQLSLFCRNMGIMLQSGLPITSALASQTEATTNVVYKNYIEKLTKGVERGKSLEETLNIHPFPFIPAIMSKMLGVGEKTGKLDESLLYLGDFFEDEVDDASRNFSVVLEPIILLGVGIVVAFLAFAIISPIYQFTGSIK